MFATYLRRELAGRKKQTVIVASGLAIAIALVIIVNALAGGVRDAQSQALESVYGVGTDLTVTGAAAGPGEGGGQRFEFGEDDGSTDDDGSTQVSQSTLTTEMGRSTLEASAVATAAETSGVAAASGALALTNMTFDGELPSAPSDASEGTGSTEQAMPQGEMPDGAAQGGGGFGGGAFDLDSISVLGVDDAAASVGPLSSVEASDGRVLEASDAGAFVAVVDATYAATNELAVGDDVELGAETFEIVGIAASTSDSADTAADVFIPLDVAQDLSGAGDVVSTVYVQASSAGDISAVQSALEDELPDATVSSQSDLASSVSGSLSSASSLITSLGTWLSVLVLAVAVLLAVLFTISGVSRRTREFGTLKAIGWTNGRVVRQVAGESVVQGLIGGAAGVVLGVVGAAVINVVQPTVSASSSASAGGPGAGAAAGAGAGGGADLPGGFGELAQSAGDITLSAPLDATIIVAAVALAVAGGLVAGAIGGWRAARLSPAEALRSVG